MRHVRILISLIVLCNIALPVAYPQEITTQGTEFWVSFMGNGYKDRYSSMFFSWHYDFTWLRIQLIISAKRDCNCTVKNPNTRYEQSFHVDANSTYLFDDIPLEEAYMELEEHGQVLNKGLIITADDTISLYCANIAEKSFDASYILPTPALGDDYLIQTYDQSFLNDFGNPYTDLHTSAFLIVAAEEGETTIDITPTVKTLDGRNANETFSIPLQKGQTYQVRSHKSNGSRDLSGTRVTARNGKKIAVFNGNNLTKVPNDGIDSDCVFEQAMPLTAWGKEFIVTASLGRDKNDIVKITSAHDNNEIRKNGTVVGTLNSGQSISFELRQSEKSCFIEASESCAVYLYNHSVGSNDGMGAPSMVWIAPTEQRINDITFSTFNYVSEHDTDIRNHYVNIIVNSDAIDNVYLDSVLLPSNSFVQVAGNPDFSFFRKEISHDVHHLSCPDGFNAHIYGFGNARGYAYMVGSKAADIAQEDEDEEEEEEYIPHDPEPINACDSIVWHDSTYYKSGNYTDTITNDLIHDIYYLDLNLTYSPKPKIHCTSPHATIFNDTIAVITNTEFFSFQYDFSIEDTLGHIDNWEFYDWHISKPSWTVEPFEKEDEPNKHFCRVYVAEPSNENVELSCTVYNHCVEDSITCSFFLKSSFFGLDEQETASADFSIVPNPNNGDMELHFENLTGKTNVKVYDMRGTLIDIIDTYNDLYSHTIHYNLKSISPSIYYFVATAKEGTIAKKVIIE